MGSVNVDPLTGMVDHRGEFIDPAMFGSWTGRGGKTRPTVMRYPGGPTCAVMAPDGSPSIYQALTLCGRRAQGLPGEDRVTCPECVEALQENGEL